MQLQFVLNAAALLIFRLRRYDHVTDALASQHYILLPERIGFKVAVMAFSVLHVTAYCLIMSCRRSVQSPLDVSPLGVAG